MLTLIVKVLTLVDLEATMNKSNKSLKNERNHESQWIEDIEDHIYAWKRHLKELKLIGA